MVGLGSSTRRRSPILLDIVLTTIGQDASASEAADGIKAIYRMLRTERETA
jgi:hypothetical protein